MISHRQNTHVASIVNTNPTLPGVLSPVPHEPRHSKKDADLTPPYTRPTDRPLTGPTDPMVKLLSFIPRGSY